MALYEKKLYQFAPSIEFCVVKFVVRKLCYKSAVTEITSL